MQVIQHFMRPKDRIALSDAGQEHYCILRCMVFDILHDQAVIVIDFHGIADRLGDPIKAAFLFKAVALLQKFFFLQIVDDNVIEIKHDEFKSIDTLGIFLLQILDPLSDFQFLFRRIIKYPVIYFIGSAA